MTELHAKTRHHDLAPVVNVRGVAGEQGEREHRQELGEAQHADRQRRLVDRRGVARDRIDLPGERDRLDLHGERVADPADPEPDISLDGEKVAERRRILQDRFRGDDACGLVSGREDMKGFVLAVAAARGKGVRLKSL